MRKLLGELNLRGLVAPLMIGMLVRCLWASLVPVHPVADSVAYWDFAKNMTSGIGYAYSGGNLTAFWPVGTSAFYTASAWLGDAGHPLAVVQNLLIYVITSLALFRFALRLNLSPSQGAAAAWLFALWPLGIQYTTIIASEMIFNASLLLALLAWPQTGSRYRAARVALFALFMVSTVYVRPTAMPLLLLIPAAAIAEHRRWWLSVRDLGIATLVAVTLISPWAIRNKAVVSDYVPISTNFGPNLWMGNNPQTNGGFMFLLPLTFENEVLRDRYYKKLALDYIKTEPLEFVKNGLKRARQTFDRETIGVHWNKDGLSARYGDGILTTLKVISTTYWWCLLLAGSAGIFVWAKASGLSGAKDLFLLYLPTGLFIAVPVIILGMDRFHVALDPFLMLGAVWLFTRTRPAGTSPTLR